jgi:hypothetical protein
MLLVCVVYAKNTRDIVYFKMSQSVGHLKRNQYFECLSLIRHNRSYMRYLDGDCKEILELLGDILSMHLTFEVIRKENQWLHTNMHASMQSKTTTNLMMVLHAESNQSHRIWLVIIKESKSEKWSWKKPVNLTTGCKLTKETSKKIREIFYLFRHARSLHNSWQYRFNKANGTFYSLVYFVLKVLLW